MVKLSTRRITDPYFGRGFESYLSTEKIHLSASPTIGLCDRLLGFEVEITPPFNAMAWNEGEDPTFLGAGYIWKTLGLQVSFLYINISLQLHIIKD